MCPKIWLKFQVKIDPGLRPKKLINQAQFMSTLSQLKVKFKQVPNCKIWVNLSIFDANSAASCPPFRYFIPLLLFSLFIFASFEHNFRNVLHPFWLIKSFHCVNCQTESLITHISSEKWAQKVITVLMKYSFWEPEIEFYHWLTYFPIQSKIRPT